MALGGVFPSFMQIQQPLSLSFNSSTVRKSVLARNFNGQEPSSTGSIAVKEKNAFPGTLSLSLCDCSYLFLSLMWWKLEFVYELIAERLLSMLPFYSLYMNYEVLTLNYTKLL
jgi:hypothetical protein